MHPDWPQDLSYQAFQNKLGVCQYSIYDQLYDYFRDKIKVKREEAAIRNLETIFNATFRLTTSGSFSAMSLRDLSRETEISMGGLYNYIASKDDLAYMIEDFLGHHLADRATQMITAIEIPDLRLEAALRTYIYMGTLFRPWYRFVFMEAKGMARPQKDIAKQYDLTDTQRFTCLLEGVLAAQANETGINPPLTASLILSMIQDWYLKHWKYSQFGIDTNTYADYVVGSVRLLLTPPSLPSSALSGNRMPGQSKPPHSAHKES